MRAGEVCGTNHRPQIMRVFYPIQEKKERILSSLLCYLKKVGKFGISVCRKISDDTLMHFSGTDFIKTGLLHEVHHRILLLRLPENAENGTVF